MKHLRSQLKAASKSNDRTLTVPRNSWRFWGAVLASAALIANVALQAQPSTTTPSHSPGLAAESLGPIYEQIERSEYEIHWQPEFGAYMAPNRANNLRFTFQGS